MKNTIKWLGIIALIAVIGFAMTGCPPEPTNTAVTFTVTFNANGGSGTAPTPQTVNSGSSITLPSGSGLTKSGFTFGGWNANAEGTGTNFAVNSSYTVTANITLYAKWIAEGTATYTVTFNANGGNGTAPSPQTASSGSSITIPNDNGLTKSGYTFGGWNANADGTGTNYAANSSYTVTANITLYAKWDVATPTTYTVTFNSNGGSAVSSITATSGTTITKPADPTKTDNTFDGWYKEAGLTNAWNFATDIVTQNITLYAKWTINQYTVTFDSNGGTPPPVQQTLDYGSKVSEPPYMTIAGYTFGGWFKEAAFTNQWDFATDTVPAADTTLYAKWGLPLLFNIGDTGPGGGKIFYRTETGFTMTDDNTTAHYLEVAPADMTTTLAWASSAFIPSNLGGTGGDYWTGITGTATGTGTGRKNTALILATDADAPAAKACNDYSNGGKTDWFLPSSDELNQLYVNRTSVGNMETDFYWTSSQYDDTYAWSQRFSDGDPGAYHKHYSNSVRAVRAF